MRRARRDAPGCAAAHACTASRRLQGPRGNEAPIRISAALNAAAEQWSRGAPLTSAIERTGYRQDQSAGLHVEGSAQALADALAQRLCGALTDSSMTEAGVLTR